jgi:hypothetical protein
MGIPKVSEDPRKESDEEYRYHGELPRLEIAHAIQDALSEHSIFEQGELVSHEECITMDFYTPGGGNFVITLGISRSENPHE